MKCPRDTVAGSFKIQAANLSQFLKGCSLKAAAQKQAHNNLTFTENTVLSTGQNSLVQYSFAKDAC